MSTVAGVWTRWIGTSSRALFHVHNCRKNVANRMRARQGQQRSGTARSSSRSFVKRRCNSCRRIGILRALRASVGESSRIQDKAGAEYLFRFVASEDVDTIASIESDGYPSDEAASLESMRFRQEKAPGAFMVAIRQGSDKQDDIGGYVCGTCTKASKLEHESMSNHDPEGKTLCIHSVCVRKDLMRKGLGSAMLKTYLKHMPGALPHLKECRLICKEHLVGFYTEAGFRLDGESDIVHGKDPWFELSYFFDE